MFNAVIALLLAGATVSQVFSTSVLLVVFDSINDEFIPFKMPSLDKDATIGRFAARSKLLKSENPTKSYAVLHTLATGVLPNEHGVIANEMFDREGNKMSNTREQFTYNKVIIPLWAEVVAKGKRSATLMWPGAEFTAMNGRKPTIIEKTIPGAEWVTYIPKIVDWFERDKPIELGMVYFEDTNSTEAVDSYTARVQRVIEELFGKIKHYDVDLIIMSSHGTKVVQQDYILKINDYVSLHECNCDFIASGGISFVRFNDKAKFQETYLALKEADKDGDGHSDHGTKFNVYKKDEEEMSQWNLKDFEYLDNTLIITTLNGHSFYEEHKYNDIKKDPKNIVRESGYHKNDPDMDGILLFFGKSFNVNVVAKNAEIQLTEIYQLIKKLLGLQQRASTKQYIEPISDNMKLLVKFNKYRKWESSYVEREREKERKREKERERNIKKISPEEFHLSALQLELKEYNRRNRRFDNFHDKRRTTLEQILKHGKPYDYIYESEDEENF